MSGGAFDEDALPGFREADFEMRELERQGRHAAALRRAGKCAHAWVQVRMAHNAGLALRRAETFAALTPGQVLCLECGAVFESTDAHEAAHAAAMWGA